MVLRGTADCFLMLWILVPFLRPFKALSVSSNFRYLYLHTINRLHTFLYLLFHLANLGSNVRPSCPSFPSPLDFSRPFILTPHALFSYHYHSMARRHSSDARRAFSCRRTSSLLLDPMVSSEYIPCFLPPFIISTRGFRALPTRPAQPQLSQCDRPSLQHLPLYPERASNSFSLFLHCLSYFASEPTCFTSI